MAFRIQDLPDLGVNQTDPLAKLAGPDSGHFDLIHKLGVRPYGIVAGSGGELAVTFASGRDFNLAAGIAIRQDGTPYALSATAPAFTIAAASADPRFDLLVIRSGTPTIITGTSSASNPQFPSPDFSTDIVLYAVLVDGAVTLGNNCLADLRVIPTGGAQPLTTTQRDALSTSGKPWGQQIINTTLNAWQLNIGIAASPLWFSVRGYGGTSGSDTEIIGAANNLWLRTNTSDDGILNHRYPGFDFTSTVYKYPWRWIAVNTRTGGTANAIRLNSVLGQPDLQVSTDAFNSPRKHLVRIAAPGMGGRVELGLVSNKDRVLDPYWVWNLKGITSITRDGGSGTTCTVTFRGGVGGNPSWANGNTVAIWGANQSQYNGSFTISSYAYGSSTGTFKITIASDPGTDATGDIGCYNVTTVGGSLWGQNAESFESIGWDEYGAFDVHGRTEGVHQNVGVGGIQHISLVYEEIDNWYDTGLTVATAMTNATSANNNPVEGTVSTIVLAGDYTGKLKYGDVILIWDATKVPGRDAPTGDGTTTSWNGVGVPDNGFTGGHEYMLVVQDWPHPYDGGWGGTGSLSYSAPNTTVKVIRGWAGTKSYPHAVGEKVWRVNRNSSGKSFLIQSGPDGSGFPAKFGNIYHAIAGGVASNIMLLTVSGNDMLMNQTALGFIYKGGGGFYLGDWDVKTKMGILEGGSYAYTISGHTVGDELNNVVQTGAYYATAGPGGVAIPATAFKITGNPASVASDHASQAPGTIFYRSDLSKFRFYEGNQWVSFLSTPTSDASELMGASASFSGTKRAYYSSLAVTLTSTPVFTFMELGGTFTYNSAGGTTMFQGIMLSSPIVNSGNVTPGGIIGFYSGLKPQVAAAGLVLPFHRSFQSTPQFSVSGSAIADSGVNAAGTQSSTTLQDTAKTWTTNQWANYDVVITGGTGNGQRRKISSNTSNTLTVTPAWTSTPDSTTDYEIRYVLTVTEYTDYVAATVIGANITVTTRRGLWFNDPVFSAGTLTTQIALDVDVLTYGTTNIGLRNGSSTVFPAKTTALLGTGTALDSRGTLLQFTTNGSYDWNGSWSMGALEGHFYIVRNDEPDANNRRTTFTNGNGSMQLPTKYRNFTRRGDVLGLLYLASASKYVEVFFSSYLTAVAITKVQIPKPVDSYTGGFTDAALAANVPKGGAFRFVQPMIVANVELYCTATGSGSTTLFIYKEDGTLIFQVSVTLNATGRTPYTPSTPLAMPAGLYYAFVHNTGATPGIRWWTGGSVFRDGSAGTDLDTQGTLASGSPPSTLDPTTITGADNSVPLLRFNGQYT